MDALLRVYLDPDEIGPDGYPFAWHKGDLLPNDEGTLGHLPIKDLVRQQAEHRCVRCGHPYTAGNPLNSERSEWSPCDGGCTHGEPTRGNPALDQSLGDHLDEAQWRILTVHHLNGIKHDCRWWNLAALCQRCHLSVQTRVVMDTEYDRPHSEWFEPYAAGWYAVKYLNEELTRDETTERLEELLSLERRQDRLPGIRAL